MKMLFAITLAIASLSTAVTASAQSTKLQGAWKRVETRTVGANPTTNTNLQPSLYIFTAKHYSMVVDLGDAPRPKAPTDVSKATAQELAAVWEPFAANAGTYEVKGNEITIRPIVAKNPQVMSAGAYRVYSYKFEGDVLILSPLRSDAGPAVDAGSFKLTRLE
jgi:hypothetical protein